MKLTVDLKMLETVFYIFVLITTAVAAETVKTYSIGVLDENRPETVSALKAAISRHNTDLGYAYRFRANVKKVPYNNILETSKTVCKLTESSNGVIAMFGPFSLSGMSMTQSVCYKLEIPHIQVNWKPSRGIFSNMSINFYPDTDKLAQGYATIIRHFNWRSYAILYEKEVALIRLQGILKIPNVDNDPVVIKELHSSGDQRAILKELRNSSVTNFIIDCETENILNILEQAKSLRMLEYSRYNYFLTSLDAHTTDFSSLDTQANITYVRLFDTDSVILENVIKDWEYEEQIRGRTTTISPDSVKTETVLMHDAANLFLSSFSELHETSNMDSTSLNCYENKIWSNGLSLISFMRKRPLENAITEPIGFNSKGDRIDFTLRVMKATSDGSRKVASWNPAKPDTLSYVVTEQEVEQQIIESLQKTDIKVSTKLGEPYLMEKKNATYLTGNDRYEGYSRDLLDELAKEFNFTYEFIVNKNYGKYDPKTKTWDGLIGDLLGKKAHLAICDLTITRQRREVVDFSKPFMTLGIGILYKKADKSEGDIFRYMSPFSTAVWIYTCTLYLVVSLMLYFISRLAPGDWENPHPCEENPEEKENIWTLENCLWLTLGSIMTQGCDILPKGISSRLATSMWWFFSLLMTSTYTANMAAFLTTERIVPTINNVEDLAKSNIKYGLVKDGSTETFFRESNHSLYQRMWTQMLQFSPSAFEARNEEGVKRVNSSRGTYAFFMESVTIEYQIERNCDLKQIGDLLDHKGYGIAMPKDAPYRSAVNKAVLKLNENGVLSSLKKKWWKEMYGGGQCDEETSSGNDIDSQRIGLANVGGVFLVLGAGTALAFVIAIGECLWSVKNVAVEEHITYWEAFVIEVKFLLDIRETRKAVKPKTSSSSSSSSTQPSGQTTREPSISEKIRHGAASFLNLEAALEKINAGNKKQ